MSDPSEDLVGAYVAVQLMVHDKEEIKGTVFTYDQALGTLMLMQNCGSERPTVKTLNTRFIKKFSVLEKDPKDAENRLPPGVAAETVLPAIEADSNESLQKRVTKLLKRAEEKRQYPTDVEVSIDACEVYDRLCVTFGSVTWSTKQKDCQAASVAGAQEGKTKGVPKAPIMWVILVGDEVIVSDNSGQNGFSWKNPLVTATKEGAGLGADRVARVKASIAAIK